MGVGRWRVRSVVFTRVEQLPAFCLVAPLADSNMKRRTGEGVTLGELLSESLYSIWRGRPSEVTNAYNGATLCDVLGADTRVRDIDGKAVLRLVNALRARGLKGSSINRHLSTLSVLLGVAQDLGEIDQRPRLRYEPEPEYRTRVVSYQEEVNLFNELCPEYRALCRFLVETGLRLGEALSLSWECVSGADVLVKNTKTRVPRRVPLTEAAQGAILDRRASGAESARGPFTQLKASTLHHRWNRAKQALLLEDDQELVPHALRHTFASRLVMAGVDLVTVKTLLGHTSLAQTMRYAHMSPGQSAQAAKALDRLRSRSVEEER